MRDQRGPWITAIRVGLVYALFYGLVYAFLWSPFGREITLGWDMLTEYWGDLGFQARWISSGDLPLWNPYERLGYPAYADPQAGQFYPINWLFYPLAWVMDWLPYWAMLLKSWLHLTLASVGMFMLLRRRGEVTAACWAGGLLYAFSAPMVDWTASALLWPSSWLPWVWLGLDRLFARPSWRRGVQAGAIGALPVLAGNPPSLFYAFLSTVFFASYLALANGRRAPYRWRYARAVMIALGAAGVTALCLGAPALLPVQQLYEHSVRTQRSLAFIVNTNLSATELWGFLLPNYGVRGYLHFGLITLFFAGVALLKTPGRVLWAAALTIFGAMIAIGGHGFLLEPLANLFPPFGLFRGPQRYSVLCAAGLAMCAPPGITALTRMAPAARRRAALVLAAIAVPVAVISGAATAGWLPLRLGIPRLAHNDTLLYSAILATAFAIVATLIGWSHKMRQTWWLVAAVIATALGLYLGGYNKINKGNIFPRPDLSHDHEFAALVDDPHNARIYDDIYLAYRPGSRLSVKDVSGYEGDPLGSIRYDALMRRVRRRPHLLRHLGTSLYLRGRHQRLGNRIRTGTRGGQFVVTDLPGVFRLVDPAPLVFVVPRPTWVDTADEARDQWLAGPVAQTAVLAREDLIADPALERLAGRAPGRATAGTLRPTGPDELVAEVDSPAGGLAVVLEAWFPGWEARVDGRPVTVQRVNYLFRGVVVGPGRHTIEMVFKPWRFTASAGLFWGALLVVLGIHLPWARRRIGWKWAARGASPAPATPDC